MGRPSFKPSAEQKEQVAGWVQGKVSIEEMARRFGWTPKTFRKHFAAELGIIPAEAVNTALESAKPRPDGFRPNDEQREWVVILAGARWPYQDIADHLRIEIAVLEKHFADELALGPKKFTAEVLKATWYAARSGNQSAAKICLVIGGPPSEKGMPQPAAEGLKGKKANAAIAAQNAEAGTGWEDLVHPASKPN